MENTSLPRELYSQHGTSVVTIAVPKSRSIVMAGDGRSTDKKNPHLSTDNNIKVFNLGNRFLLGTSGSHGFCVVLAYLLKKAVREGDFCFSKLEKDALDIASYASQLLDEVSDKIFGKKRRGKLLPYSATLAGFDEKGKARIWQLGYKSIVEKTELAYVGSARRYAMREARKFECDMGTNKAIDISFRSLLRAAKNSKGTRGDVTAMVMRGGMVETYKTNMNGLALHYRVAPPGDSVGLSEYRTPFPFTSVERRDEFIDRIMERGGKSRNAEKGKRKRSGMQKEASDHDSKRLKLSELPADNPGLDSSPDQATKSYFIGQTMLRIKDPKISLDFYSRILGMSLLKRLDNPRSKCSSYIMGYKDIASAPSDAVQRTVWAFSQEGTLELAHKWGTESEDIEYHNGNTSPLGFGHVGIAVDDASKACKRFERLRVGFLKKPNYGNMKRSLCIMDPDGYHIEIFDRSISSNF